MVLFKGLHTIIAVRITRLSLCFVNCTAGSKQTGTDMAWPAENFKLLMFLFFLALTVPSCKTDNCSSLPMQEESKGTLRCASSASIRELVWQVQREGIFVNLVSCNFQGQCQNQTSSYWASGQNITNGTQFESVLTITRANRSESVFKCVVDGGYAEKICNVQVYVKPENPTCSSPIAYSEDEVALSCSTNRVYPQAYCMFSYSQQSAVAQIRHLVTYNHTSSPTSPGDNATVCTAIIETTGLKPGTYQLSVRMFPTIVKVPFAASVSIANVPNIILSPPTANISEDCPQGPSISSGYIDARFSSGSTCSCKLADAGFPPGQAIWYTASGSETGVRNSLNRSSDVILTYNPNDTSPAFECRAKTVLDITTPGKLYRPLYAVGPSSVSTEVSNDVFNLCPTKMENITVTCEVPTSQVKPEPRFSILVDSQTHVQKQAGQLTSTAYSYIYSFRPPSGGNLLVSCQAENSIFPDAKTDTTEKIEVREPPSNDPQIVVSVKGYERDSGDIIAIESGGDILVTCHVDGGHPLVESVTLTCGSQPRKSTGSRSSTILTATEKTNALTCYCDAVHVTGCYQKSAKITLHAEILTSSGGTETSNLPLIVGLSTGLGALAVAFIAVLIVVMRKRRRNPSRPPTYTTEWVNKADYITPSSSPPSVSGNDRSDYSLPADFRKSPEAEIYDEIGPPSYYSYSKVGYVAPTPHHTNNGLHDGYIQPII